VRLDEETRVDSQVGTGLAVGEQLGEHADGMLSNLRNVRQPRLFVISGPSGVGKDTVIELMRPLYPDAYFAVTATTRPRRPGEIDGVHYYFLDKDTFIARQADGEFLESAVVYGHHYGVPRTPIRTAIARGEDVFIKVDVQGAARDHDLPLAGINGNAVAAPAFAQDRRPGSAHEPVFDRLAGAGQRHRI
jgi:hypothetical protein